MLRPCKSCKPEFKTIEENFISQEKNDLIEKAVMDTVDEDFIYSDDEDIWIPSSKDCECCHGFINNCDCFETDEEAVFCNCYAREIMKDHEDKEENQ